MQIAIITGEASGDRVGGHLAAEIKRLRPDADVWGVGGKYLRESGADVLVDSSRWGVVGAAQAIGLLPRMLKARSFVLKELRRRKPDVLVAVDAGALHTGFGPIEGILPWARRRLPETRTFYYFPPASWRQKLKGTRLAPLVDGVATPFPWSATELTRLGVPNVEFVGHPLLDFVRPENTVPAFTERFGIDRNRPVVGILPGSRRQEIDQLLPIQLEAAAIIHRRVPGVQFVLALAPTVDREDVVRAVEALRRKSAHLRDALHRIEERLRAEMQGRRLPPSLVTTEGTLLPPRALSDLHARTQQQLEDANRANRGDDFGLIIVENATYDVMASSDVLMITSGTATLEAAILGRPMVIMYRLSQNNFIEYQIVKKNLPAYIGLPNLIADQMICPEFVQDAATPEAVASEIIALLLEPERMLTMRKSLRDVVERLGEPGGATRAAQRVIALAEQATVQDGI